MKFHREIEPTSTLQYEGAHPPIISKFAFGSSIGANITTSSKFGKRRGEAFWCSYMLAAKVTPISILIAARGIRCVSFMILCY
jgi:hypothetical protein